MSDTPFRFGYQLRDGSADELIASAVAAEAAGFDVVHTSDHVGAFWPPLSPMMAIAAAKDRARVRLIGFS